MDDNFHEEGSKKKKTFSEKESLKSSFEQDIERKIEEYVDGLDLDEDPSLPSLQSTLVRREKMKMEIAELMEDTTLMHPIEDAVNLVFLEGERYLSKEANQTLLSDLSNAATLFAGISVEEASSVNLQTLAKISDTSMKSLVDFAIAKFDEERYSDCFALFSLLTILNPAYSEYWLRLGIVAQKCDKFETASNAYAAALELDPDNIGARLFAAECFVKRSLKEEAKAELEAANKIIKSEDVDPKWLEVLSSIKNQLQ